MTAKKYIKPKINIILPIYSDMLYSSMPHYYICTNKCKLWHICRDRLEGNYCKDKKLSD